MIHTNKRFISEIEGFSFPNGILNKRLAGCGATEFAITNNEPTVILSPRIGLIESKVKQHPELLEVKAGVTVEDIQTFKGKKIISTYDSFYKINEALDLTQYRIICDEMQFIIKDSSFKSNVIRRLLNDLQALPKVTYLSATPLENIFKELSYFKSTPYEEIDWTENTVKEKLNLISAKSPLLEAAKLVKTYASGVCKENTDSIVVFVNSINGICSIIKRAKLTPENTTVLMADTDTNKAKLSKIGFTRGSLPNKGEEYKPITLCTSAYAAGADFYNEAAVLYIISDVYVTKPFSIADEIPQIAGRLRLGNRGINLIYKTGKVTYDSIEVKRARTAELIEGYNKTTGVVKEKQISSLETSLQIGGPCDTDYMFYNRDTEKFEEDELAIIADTYNVQILDTYKNGVLLIKGLENNFNTEKTSLVNEEVVETIKRDRGFETAFQQYVEGSAFEKAAASIQYPEILKYLKVITTKQAKALGYQESKIKRFIADESKMQDIKLEILKTFTTSISVKDAKVKLAELYQSKHIQKTARVSDIVALLPDYYDTKNVRENGKIRYYLFRIK